MTSSPKTYSFTWLPKILRNVELELYDIDAIALLFKVTLVRPKQPLNADSPMLVTLLGMMTEVRPVHL